MGGDNMNEKLEDIITELFDEIEKAQKDSQDLIKSGMNGEAMTYYAMGLLKAVRIIRGKKSERE